MWKKLVSMFNLRKKTAAEKEIIERRKERKLFDKFVRRDAKREVEKLVRENGLTFRRTDKRLIFSLKGIDVRSVLVLMQKGKSGIHMQLYLDGCIEFFTMKKAGEKIKSKKGEIDPMQEFVEDFVSKKLQNGWRFLEEDE